MKRKFLFMLLGLVCVGVAAGSGVLFLDMDKTGPEIVVSEDRKIAYETNGDKTVLLDGVTAIDKKDGDVSDSLRVESIHNNEDGSLEVTYSAVDHSNNVTKKTCMVEVENQETEGSEAEQQPAKEAEQTEEQQQAETPEDVSENPADGEEVQQQEEAQQQQPEESVSDTEANIAALPEGSPQVRLSRHQADLQVGASFQYMDYIESISDDKDDSSELYRKIRLEGEVNTAEPGEYTISYYVVDSEQKQSNVETLIVTVHE